ncbi:LOW QUALITY PROTEIN: hypothetical protein NC653_025508 [Populus alba x Populus x berolinensis]|uniref:DUF7787 domain-containing protein n=1 Tax=Populus alba x Populus x berolinensis TaxID=444605 RepID=A0AAD6MBE7_9ROSI|nr:LOW QUALITY PROTEIN: hypothetical protein NC653_025508 [Populus alba x Populus x berolinensis]
MGKTEEEEARLHTASAINHVRIQILDCRRSQGNMVPFNIFQSLLIESGYTAQKIGSDNGTLVRSTPPHSSRDMGSEKKKENQFIWSSDPALSLQLRIISAPLVCGPLCKKGTSTQELRMRTEVHRAGNFPPQRGMNPLQANQNPTTPPHPLTSQLQYPHSEKKTMRESPSVSDQKIPRRKKTLSLEDHASFIEDPFNDVALTTARIYQIVLMHGFRRTHKRSKAPTQRSTLEDNFLPYDDASLSLGEAKQDLESLKWQECSDQSIETVLFNHKTNGEVKSSGHDDALKSFVRSSQEEEKI